MKKRIGALACLGLAAAGWSGVTAVQASVIPLVSASASSGLGGGFDRTAIHTVDGSGLSGDSHSAVPDGEMWLTNGTFAAPNDITPQITFDLGAAYVVDTMRVWNYNETGLPTRGLTSGRISVAGADQVFSPVIADQAFTAAPGVAGDFSQSISLGGATARYVRVDNIVHLGDNGFAGLSEVRFDGSLAPGESRELPIPATIQSVSSSIKDFNRDATYVVTGVGLGGAAHSRTPGGTMWLNQGTFGNVPPEQFDTDPFIVFDVGAETSLDRVVIWNYNEALPGRDDLLNRGIKTADILVAGDDLVFTTLIEAQELTIAPGTDDVDFGQAIDLAGVTARYIKLDNLVNFGNNENFVGLSEVQFYAVPEPGALTLLAMSSLLLLFRRRK